MAGFAKFDGIDGESTEAQHEAWVGFLSLDWGVARQGAATGQSRRRGSVVVDDLVLVCEYEKAMPKLLEHCLQGRVLPKVEIELTSAFGGAHATYLRYELSNVMVSSYRVSASGDGDAGPPTVSLSLGFEQIKVTYSEYGPAGNVVSTVETKYALEKQLLRSEITAPATTAKKSKKSKKRKK